MLGGLRCLALWFNTGRNTQDMISLWKKDRHSEEEQLECLHSVMTAERSRHVDESRVHELESIPA